MALLLRKYVEFGRIYRRIGWYSGWCFGAAAASLLARALNNASVGLFRELCFLWYRLLEYDSRCTYEEHDIYEKGENAVVYIVKTGERKSSLFVSTMKKGTIYTWNYSWYSERFGRLGSTNSSNL